MASSRDQRDTLGLLARMEKRASLVCLENADQQANMDLRENLANKARPAQLVSLDRRENEVKRASRVDRQQWWLALRARRVIQVVLDARDLQVTLVNPATAQLWFNAGRI